MIHIHHLNNSRSQRILWLMEELDIPYEIIHYKRLSPIPVAPPELKKIHPLGKAPIITDGDVIIAESGAIIEYIIDKYGQGKMRPVAASKDWIRYIEWMHYAEGSAMLPIMLHTYMGFLGDKAAPLFPKINQELKNTFAYIAAELDGNGYFVGSSLTGADIMMAFVLESALAGNLLGDNPILLNYLDRMHARPAYKRALEKGGPYNLAENRKPAAKT